MNTLPRFSPTKPGWEGSKKESPAVTGLSLRTHYSPVTKVLARISLARKLVKHGCTGATKWHRTKMGRCCSDNTAGVEQSL